MLATRYGSQPHAEFLAAEERRRAALRVELECDRRYAQIFRTDGDNINRAVVRTVDAIAVHLSRGTDACVAIADAPQRDGAAAIELRPVGERAYRLHPWPLVGRRLELSTEGRVLPAARFADAASLRRAWDAAPLLRLSWTLLATDEPAD